MTATTWRAAWTATSARLNHSLQNTNPQLAASLANNGGLTQTLALLDGSPAINQIPTTGEYDCAYYSDG